MSTVESRIGVNHKHSAESNVRPGADLARLLFETDGQDMVEYALLTTFIGFAGAAAWIGMRTSLGNAYTGFNQAVWNLWEPSDPVGASS